MTFGFNTWSSRRSFVAKFKAEECCDERRPSTADRSSHSPEWQPEISAVGETCEPFVAWTVTTESPGSAPVQFKSGDEVGSGAVLVELNADAEIAQLHALEAAAELSANCLLSPQRSSSRRRPSARRDWTAMRPISRTATPRRVQAALVRRKLCVRLLPASSVLPRLNPGQYLNPGDKVVTLEAARSCPTWTSELPQLHSPG